MTVTDEHGQGHAHEPQIHPEEGHHGPHPSDATYIKVALFLAFLTDPRQVQAVLETYSAEDRALVERQISRARSEHFVEDIVKDVIAAAAPVFDARGICATIALISTTSRLGSGPATEQAKLLFETVRQLSSELGHADPVWASSAG